MAGFMSTMYDFMQIIIYEESHKILVGHKRNSFEIGNVHGCTICEQMTDLAAWLKTITNESVYDKLCLNYQV